MRLLFSLLSLLCLAGCGFTADKLLPVESLVGTPCGKAGDVWCDKDHLTQLWCTAEGGFAFVWRPYQTCPNSCPRAQCE